MGNADKKGATKSQKSLSDLKTPPEEGAGQSPAPKKKKPRGRPPGSTNGKTKAGKGKPSAKEDTDGAMVDGVLAMANATLKEQGIKPMNPAQTMLIRVGLIGCAKKYGLDLANMPEVELAMGLGWYGYDAFLDIKKREKVDVKAGESMGIYKTPASSENSNIVGIIPKSSAEIFPEGFVEQK